MMNRKSGSYGKRRSSILKIDLNRDDDTTGVLFNKSRVQSRRVSFAETAQIKEFPRDSPRVWRLESEEEEQDKENEPSRNKAGGVSVMGLDSLLNGTIETQSIQNIIECPIPEMSAESFNLGIGNETVNEPFEMELTLCTESADVELPRFPTEPSMELKFEVPSFLASLKRNTECMSPLQIYRSPKERPQKASFFDSDQENMPPIMMDFQMEEPQMKLRDSKSFLSGLFNSKETKSFPISNGKNDCENEEMEEIVDIRSVKTGGHLQSDKENIPTLMDDSLGAIGNKTVILGDTMGGIEETACIGGILSNADESKSQLNRTQSSSMEKTKYFEDTMDVDAMQMTHCHGMILDSTNSDINRTDSIRMNKDLITVKRKSMTGNRTILGDDIGELEETACIGGILSNIDKENIVPSSVKTHTFSNGDRTRYFGETTLSDAMEETQCVGTILKNDLTGQSRSGVLSNSGVVVDKTDKTKYFDGEDDMMEETKCVNSVESAETSRGILKDVTPDRFTIEKTQTEQSSEDRDSTRYYTDNKSTFVMEETLCSGGILQQSISEKINKSLSEQTCESGVDKTKYFTDGDYTMGVEETRCMGGIEQGQAHNTLQGKSSLDLDKTKYFNDSKQHVGIEETNCIGGIIDNSFSETNSKKLGEKSYIVKEYSRNESNDITEDKRNVKCTMNIENTPPSEKKIPGNPQLHRTVLGNVTMEETRPVGGVLEGSISDGNRSVTNADKGEGFDKNRSLNNIDKKADSSPKLGILSSSRMEECYQKNDQNGNSNEFNVSVLETDKRNSDLLEDTGIHQMCPDITDTEITFKTTNKRTLSDVKSSDSCVDRTRDLTETRTRDLTETSLSRKSIKEMLMMSAQKAAPHIRAGIIKTPSKPSSDIVTNTYSTSKSMTVQSPVMSPAHKRIRLFEATAAQQREGTDDLGVGPLTELDGENNNDLGIEDETMPDYMQTDVLSSTTGVSETQTESGLNHTIARGSNDSRASSSDINLSNLSMLSNRSILAKPQVIPDGPMTLETFFKLTVKPLSCLKSVGRCSVLFTRKINYECPEEVLEAELVDGPLVDAKKKLHERITERHLKNEENIAWLQKTLEETQPQIFQDVARGNADEIEKITEELYSLYSCCSKEADIVWKQEIKEMFEETVERVEDEGVKRAEGLLDDIQTQCNEVDQLITSMDNDMKELDQSEVLLRELQARKHGLESELNVVMEEVEKKRMAETELKTKIAELQENHMIQETRASFRQQILQQLILVDWNLEELAEDCVSVLFLDEEFCVFIQLQPGSKEKQIKDIKFESRLESCCPLLHKKMAHSLLLASLDRDYLLNKYKDYSSLPKMLREISASASEIDKIAEDVQEVIKEHKLSWDGNMLSFEVWSFKTLKMVKLFVKFYPRVLGVSESSVTVSVRRQLGNINVADLEKYLQEIVPGSKYLKRLIQAVKHNLLETIQNV